MTILSDCPLLCDSCYGSVMSLNGEAEPDVIVEAVGLGPDSCTQLQEESKSEVDGSFRIRGLQVRQEDNTHNDTDDDDDDGDDDGDDVDVTSDGRYGFARCQRCQI